MRADLRDAVLAATAGRDRVVDAVKAAALVMVVVAHNLAWTIFADGSLGNTLNAVPGVFWLTWVFEIIPLFFVVAGWGLHRLAGRGSGVVFGRTSRLLGPALPLLLVTVVLAFVVPRVFNPDLASAAGILPVQLLWFVGVYLLVIACTPVLLRINAWWQFLVWLLLIGGIDWLRVTVTEAAGWANLLLVWSLFAALGVNLDRLRKVPLWAVAVATVACIAGAITLVDLGPYSAALISTDALPGITNLAPPTLVLALAGCAQAGVLLLLWSTLERLLRNDRTWVPVALFSARAMQLYLWHVLVMALLVAAVLALGLTPPALSAGWWLIHVVVLVIDIAVILALAPVLDSVAKRLLSALSRLVPAGVDRLPAAIARILAVALGLTTLLVSEGGLQDLFTVRTIVIIPYLPVAALVVLLGGTALAARAAKPPKSPDEGRNVASMRT